ncbi:ankyrin repeat-containing domain protein [Lactarius sanguifluus]|nr:ankyrin repeat-containing domain protein [Lactarius sanguifluus]
MEEALHLRVRFVGINPLLAAAYFCSGTEIVDFLLEKGCDPSERDFRGWNIYHLACLSPDNRRVKFVEHLLKTLPEELTHELMAQTSREAVNTPLMLAVKHGNAATAQIILEFGIDPGILLLRDADWSTPLHVAVQNADTVLAEVLLKYGPTQLLYAENSVGQTPLDIASLKGLPRETGSTGPPLFDVEKQKTEIPKLRATLDTLLADGLPRGRHQTNDGALRLRGSHGWEARNRDCAEDLQQMKENWIPSNHKRPPRGQYFALRDAAAARPGTRQLVHMVDVQRSVQRNLARQVDGILVRWSERARKNDEEDKKTDPEKERIAELKARSLLASGSRGGFDPKEVDLYSEDKL